MTETPEHSERHFETEPVRYIHPERSGEWLPDLPASVANELMANARLKPKLSRIIAAHYDLDPCPPMSDDRDYAIAALPEPRLCRIIETAGAVWHGRAFARLIDKAAIRAALNVIDEDTFRLAIAQSGLAPMAESPISAPQTPTREALESDGKLCFSSWLNALPAYLNKRIALKFSPKVKFEAPSPKHDIYGPAIIRKCGEGCLVH